MAVKYGKFELPTKIKKDETAKKANFARFIAEPFERGFAHTIGNSLRRVLLNSMEAPSIISVRIEGVSHEFTGIEGIIEDMTHIILNFKCALLRKIPTDDQLVSKDQKCVTKVLDITHDMIEKAGGTYPVTVEDVFGDSEYDVINPDFVICHVSKPLIKRFDIRIAIGRGYTPSERHQLEDKHVDEILIDSTFTPVRLVNYFVENTRVGQDTDFDKLILEVTTDGRISPEEALSFATQITVLHLQVFEKIEQHMITFEQGEVQLNTDLDALMSKMALRINEIELSVRSTNCLVGANIETIAELVIMPESEMLKFRNFGKKSLNEIKAKLEEMGLHLGMELGKLGITRDNVKDMITEYNTQKAGIVL